MRLGTKRGLPDYSIGFHHAGQHRFLKYRLISCVYCFIASKKGTWKQLWTQLMGRPGTEEKEVLLLPCFHAALPCSHATPGSILEPYDGRGWLEGQKPLASERQAALLLLPR